MGFHFTMIPFSFSFQLALKQNYLYFWNQQLFWRVESPYIYIKYCNMWILSSTVVLPYPHLFMYKGKGLLMKLLRDLLPSHTSSICITTTQPQCYYVLTYTVLFRVLLTASSYKPHIPNDFSDISVLILWHLLHISTSVSHYQTAINSTLLVKIYSQIWWLHSSMTFKTQWRLYSDFMISDHNGNYSMLFHCNKIWVYTMPQHQMTHKP